MKREFNKKNDIATGKIGPCLKFLKLRFKNCLMLDLDSNFFVKMYLVYFRLGAIFLNQTAS